CSSSPRTDVTRTRAPAGTDSVARALHDSPRARTTPVGSSARSTNPSSPTSTAVGCVASGSRRAITTARATNAPSTTTHAPAARAGARLDDVQLTPRSLLYRTYERRLEHQVHAAPLPEHVGIILDGNRRWARAMGYEDAAEGHRRGADKIDHLLGWCDELGIP